MIEIRDLVAIQGDFTLKVDSLSLRPGELIAVLGNNGSGKSTFLGLLSGLKRYSGEYLLKDRDFSEYPVIERNCLVCLLPQVTSLNMPFDVEYVVLTGRYPYTNGRGYSDRDMEQTAECLKRLDIYHLRHRQYNELSGGERQRVLLARVINRDSPVMLLDEPLTGVDLRHQHEIVEHLKTLKRDRLIMVVVHDLALAVREFDRFLFFVDGQLRYDLRKDALDEEILSEVFQVRVNFVMQGERVIVYTEGGDL